MFVEPTTAIGAGLAAIEHRKQLMPFIRKIRYWIRHGRLQIMVFGPGGTGKTTLGKYLSGGLLLANPVEGYRESIDIENFPLQGDFVGGLVVPPGQPRRQYTWQELYSKLATGASVGVINVVSWGYHSFADVSFTDTRYYQPGMTPDQFLEVYLTDRRQRELEIINELAPRLKDAKRNIWMITLCTKQDLWWSERNAVKHHYMEGEYNNLIKEVLAQRGIQHFAHDYLSASLYISNFGTTAGELLAPTVSGYDQNIQFANLRKLLETVTILANR